MKKLFSLMLGFVLLFSMPVKVFADGMIVHPKPYPVYETGQKALIIYKDGREDLVISVSFDGSNEDFGWIIPLPNEPEISKADPQIFDKLAELTQPKSTLLEKLKEDRRGYINKYSSEISLGGPTGERQNSTVQVIKEDSIGVFDYAVLKTEKADDLRDWMTKNGYSLPSSTGIYEPANPGLLQSPDELDYYDPYYNSQNSIWSDSLPIIKDYIDNDWCFVLVKVNNEFADSFGVKKKLESGSISPLRFSFDTTDKIFPMRLSSIAKQNVGVIIYTIDDKKQEVENYTSFTTSFAGKISKSEIADLTKEIGKGSWFEAEKNMVITKLYTGQLSYELMNYDVVIVDAKDQGGVNNGTMSFSEWVQLPFVLLFLIPIFMVGGIFDINNLGGSYYGDLNMFPFCAGFIVISSIVILVFSVIFLKRTKKKAKRVLIYLVQFPAVFFISLFLSILSAILVVFAALILDLSEDIIMLDSLLTGAFTLSLLPVVFYRLLWKNKKQGEQLKLHDNDTAQKI